MSDRLLSLLQRKMAPPLIWGAVVVVVHWTLRAGAQDWAMFALFVAVATVACLIFKLAHALAVEMNAHAEADLAAGLARLLLRAPDLNAALPVAARHLTRVLDLPSAAIELRETGQDEGHVAFPLWEKNLRMGTLLVPAGVPKPTLRRLEKQVAPSLQVLLNAARERERVGAALKSSRDELRRVADEQAALRRLATLVAYGMPAAEVFGVPSLPLGSARARPARTASAAA